MTKRQQRLFAVSSLGVGLAMIAIARFQTPFAQNVLIAIGSIVATALPLFLFNQGLSKDVEQTEQERDLERARADRAVARANTLTRQLREASDALQKAGVSAEVARQQRTDDDLNLAAIAATNPTEENIRQLLHRASERKVLARKYVRAPIANTHTALYLRVGNYSKSPEKGQQGHLELRITSSTNRVHGGIDWTSAIEIGAAVNDLIDATDENGQRRFILDARDITDSMDRIIELAERMLQARDVQLLGRALQFADNQWVVTDRGLEALDPPPRRYSAQELRTMGAPWRRPRGRESPSKHAISEARRSAFLAAPSVKFPKF